MNASCRESKIEGATHTLRRAVYVGDRTLTSRRISFSVMTNAAMTRGRQVAAYPVGKKVTVYYDPQNPSSAVLERQPSLAWLGLSAVGTLFLVIGVLIP